MRAIYAALMAMDADERLAFIDGMRTLFCLHCGEDYPAWAPGVCHCMDDD